MPTPAPANPTIAPIFIKPLSPVTMPTTLIAVPATAAIVPIALTVARAAVPIAAIEPTVAAVPIATEAAVTAGAMKKGISRRLKGGLCGLPIGSPI
jgi:ethanolamine utilization microcompartment shell protein EutS